MSAAQRLLLFGCCLFVAVCSFCTVFLGDLVYVSLVNSDLDRCFSQKALLTALQFGCYAAVLSAKSGVLLALELRRLRLQAVLLILASAGYLGAILLVVGIAVCLLEPYF